MRPLKPDPAKDPTLVLERELLANNPAASAVIGVDEAGRGAIAGPVAVGAHAFRLSDGDFPVGLRDSKILSEKRREWIRPAVTEWGPGAVAFGAAQQIDEHGITKVLAETARAALLELHDSGIDITAAIILLDGSHDWLSPALKRPLNIVLRVGADRQHACVAAASLRAKTARDALMIKAAEDHPPYLWHQNKGYGSAAHYEAIGESGLTPLHRKTWIDK